MNKLINECACGDGGIDKTESANIEDETHKNDKKKVDMSRIQINCFAKAALTIDELNGQVDPLDVATVMDKLIDGAQRITDGNTKEIEGMLFSHAKTLDYLFYDALGKLARSDMLNKAEAFANIAFRAQNQSRKTLLALSELKNPRKAMFIKQQNNALNQQINHADSTQLQKFENCDKVANELLEVKKNEQWLDTTTQRTPIKTDPTMETLDSINRSKDTKRPIYKQDECL